MIRKLLATTAITAFLAGGALAQTTTPPVGDAPAATGTERPMVVHADGHLATNLMGQNVYNSTGDDAENIGEVVDLVIGEQGNVDAVVVGVGGFLGIGQKDVALEYDLVEWDEQSDGTVRVVVPTTKEALETQEAFDRSAFKPMPADAQVGKTTPVTKSDLDTTASDTTDRPAAEAATNTAMSDTPSAADAPAASDAPPAVAVAPSTDPTTTSATSNSDDARVTAVDRSTLSEVPEDQISADTLIGTTVYGMNDENIGEINDVILSGEGNVDAVIVDVGGFLGIGEKSVAVSMENLKFLADEDGDRYLYTQFTKDQLEAQPEYDEASYANERDRMLLNVQ